MKKKDRHNTQLRHSFDEYSSFAIGFERKIWEPGETLTTTMSNGNAEDPRLYVTEEVHKPASWIWVLPFEKEVSEFSSSVRTRRLVNKE